MKIFISHASEQQDIAETLEVALGGEGHGVFLDRSDLPPGETFNDQIREAVAQSDLFIFLISPEAVAKGRYTLTELEFAREKWRAPSRHVLPVVVTPTDLASVPAYLKAVTLLEPQGNIPAAVAAAVAGLTHRWWRRPRTWVAALLAVVVIVIGASVGLRRGFQRRETTKEASRLLDAGRLQHESGRYSAAWDLYAQAVTVRPEDDAINIARERLAMDWLDNIRVTAGKSTFTSIVEQVDPVLVRCAASKDAVRAADCQAHIGWGDFLRSREGIGGLEPGQQYRRALERDPDNVYAHTMMGFDILRLGGPVATARPHFDKAVASNRAGEYVRHLQIAGLLWSHDSATEDEVVRVANDMRRRHEPISREGETRSDNWRLWDVYYDRIVNAHQLEQFLMALPAPDHLATFQWLFPEADVPTDKHDLYSFMLANLQEHGGNRGEALATYRSLRDTLAREGALKSGGPLPERTVAAVQRLSK